jgi:two-component system OmpR family response regulator
MARVLIIDDEPGVRDMLADALGAEGYTTVTAGNGAEGLDALRRDGADLCIVDVNMPHVNGFEFLSRLRENDRETPVILLSARVDADDVEAGLRFGADDYVRKPFSVNELLLRVGNMLRRRLGGDRGDHVLDGGRISMNVDRHELTLDGELVELSATEYRLAQVLLERANRLVTREQLLREVWNIDFDSDTSVLDTYISYVRRKLHRDGYAPITTVRGVGFKFVTD